MGFLFSTEVPSQKKEKNVGNGKKTEREKKSSVVDDGKSLLSFFSLPVRRLLGKRSLHIRANKFCDSDWSIRSYEKSQALFWTYNWHSAATVSATLSYTLFFYLFSVLNWTHKLQQYLQIHIAIRRKCPLFNTPTTSVFRTQDYSCWSIRMCRFAYLFCHACYEPILSLQTITQSFTCTSLPLIFWVWTFFPKRLLAFCITMGIR